MEQPPVAERIPEGESLRQEKRREACSEICEMAEGIFTKARERVLEEGDYGCRDRGSGKRFAIETAADFVVAVAERELEEAEGIRDAAREEGAYDKERVAATLVEFLTRELATARSLAELDSTFPELSTLLQRTHPHIKAQLEEAEENRKAA